MKDYYIMGGCILLFVIILVIVIILVKNKKRKQLASTPIHTDFDPSIANKIDDSIETVSFGPEVAKENETPITLDNYEIKLPEESVAVEQRKANFVAPETKENRFIMPNVEPEPVAIEKPVSVVDAIDVPDIEEINK